MKVIIAGSRNFNDYQRLYDFCEKVLANQKDIEIVSGTAEGADCEIEFISPKKENGSQTTN